MIILEYELKAARLLVVDDDVRDLKFMIEILNQAGFHSITSVQDSIKAVELFLVADYDLVLLDLNMPDLDGFEVIKQFKKCEKQFMPPVLVLTGLEEKNLRLKALREGARDFLEKSFEPEEIITRITNTLEMHLSQQRLMNYNHVLEQAVQERTQKLEKAQTEIIQRLSYAAEYRDTETASHTLRVGKYSKILARGFGFSKKESNLMFYAAPMHDIGKIGIPDNILLKPGKLSAEEWVIMKTHTTIGGEILADSSTRLMEAARIIALSHHEKWDGSGYPKGLSGEKIPVFGRIAGLVDVFDALTTDRPYKEAWSLDKTLAYIIQGAGNSFDPNLVKIFREVLPEIKAIQQKYRD